MDRYREMVRIDGPTMEDDLSMCTDEVFEYQAYCHRKVTFRTDAIFFHC